MEAFLTAVSTVGFPIALTIFLLIRFEKRIEQLTSSINGRDGILDKIDDIKKLLNQKGK